MPDDLRDSADAIGDEFEKAVCCAAMLWPEFVSDLPQVPRARDFRASGAEDLWAAILQCQKEKGRVIKGRVVQIVKDDQSDANAVAVIRQASAELVRRESAIEGAAYICARANQIRALRLANEFAMDVCGVGPIDSLTIIERFEKQIIDLSAAGPDEDAWVWADALAEIDQPTIPTGWPSLDTVIGGLPLSTLTVIAGRPGMGKSAFAVSLALNLACENQGVGFFSLEMPARDLRDRMSCAQAYRPGAFMSGISDNPYYSSARRGELTQAQQARFEAAEAEVKQLPIAFDDRKGLKIGRIRIAGRRLKAAMQRKGTPLVAIFVDHLQHIRPDIDRKGNRTGEVTDITGSLMEMAAELDVAVIALSQLNREVEKRTEKRPQLSDLRESGSIEQDAHTIMMLYRPAYYFELARKGGEEISLRDEAAARHSFEVNVVKQRNGPIQRVDLNVEIGANAFTDPAIRKQARAA